MAGPGVAAKGSDDLLGSLERQRRESPALLPRRSVPSNAGMSATPAPPPALPRAGFAPLAAGKFRDPGRTLDGSVRARVALRALETLWVNTGTLCNLACAGCYIESSPRNDRLAFFTRADLRGYLGEIAARGLPTALVGFTGGEPFVNPELPGMLEDVLAQGLDALVLTNAMRPMRKAEAALLSLRARHGERLLLRVSLDHHGAEVHDRERGAGSWETTLDGLAWLSRHGFRVHVASRMLSGEDEAGLREGYAALFALRRLPVDAADPVALTLFPEMDGARDVPEITEACWGILRREPDSVMCSASRMLVRRQGAAAAVVACTLLPYDARFELGGTLAEASGEVALNHPHCARFCVLGGASCARSAG
jgi:uncharacterized Fe-S cluster-containing radical SAM superfamily protein